MKKLTEIYIAESLLKYNKIKVTRTYNLYEYCVTLPPSKTTFFRKATENGLRTINNTLLHKTQRA